MTQGWSVLVRCHGEPDAAIGPLHASRWRARAQAVNVAVRILFWSVTWRRPHARVSTTFVHMED